MSRNLAVSEIDWRPVQDRDIEIVERKGIGHPDTLCDGMAEAICRELSKEYLDRVGGVLHHNTDAVQISGGRAAIEFGDAELLEPMYVLLGGQATKEFEGTYIPTDTIAIEAAREYLDETIRHLDVDSQVAIDTRLDEGTTQFKQTINLESLSEANDTSYGVGYAPLSETERLVLEVERALTTDLYEELPALGEDVKVMAKRDGEEIDLTVAAPTVARHVPDLDRYREILDRVRSFVQSVVADVTDYDVTIHLNVLDDFESESVFLTAVGTVAEAGDDAAVGRGNRVNGLITPSREMSLDAANGKNPVNHVGKLYNLLGTELAGEIHGSVDGVEFANVKILSQIGERIDRPHVVDVAVRTVDGVDAADVEPDIDRIVDDGFRNLPDLIDRVIAGEVRTF